VVFPWFHLRSLAINTGSALLLRGSIEQKAVMLINNAIEGLEKHQLRELWEVVPAGPPALPTVHHCPWLFPNLGSTPLECFQSCAPADQHHPPK